MAPTMLWEEDSIYIDFIASANEETSKRALDHLGEYALTLRVLGSYARFRG